MLAIDRRAKELCYRGVGAVISRLFLAREMSIVFTMRFLNNVYQAGRVH